MSATPYIQVGKRHLKYPPEHPKGLIMKNFPARTLMVNRYAKSRLRTRLQLWILERYLGTVTEGRIMADAEPQLARLAEMANTQPADEVVTELLRVRAMHQSQRRLVERSRAARQQPHSPS